MSAHYFTLINIILLIICGISCISVQSIQLANKTDIKREVRKQK